MKYETTPEACKNGHISAKKKPIDIRLLLSTKIKPEEERPLYATTLALYEK